MRIVRTIVTPTSGERIVGISPVMEPDVDSSARRRLNLFTGRALTDQALQTEQNSRSLHMSTWSRSVAPGVVSGLEVDVDRGTLYLSSGTGLTAQGEDVTVPRPTQVRLDSVRVDSSGTINGDHSRRTFDEVRGHDASLPTIVVLKPVVLEYRRKSDDLERDTNDAWSGSGATAVSHCGDDPSAYAFEDWQLVDAVQVVLYLWPTAYLPLPPRELMSQPNKWRNCLAWSIFEAERDLSPNVELPWHSTGLPVALIGFNAKWQPQFADRHSVVRQGAGAKRRTPLIVWYTPGPESNEVPSDLMLPNRAGTPQLYHAQLSQLSDHIVDLSRTPGHSALNEAFSFVPPAAILPRSVATLGRGIATHACRNHFFPPSYQVDFAPVPLEQLDTVMRRSVSLERFNLGVADHVRMLVPVPQSVYEPNLLRVEVIDGVFDERVTSFEVIRNRELRRRYAARSILETLYRSVKGRELTFPADDAAALTGNEPSPDGIDFLDDAEEVKEEERKWKGKFGTTGDFGDNSLVSTRVALLREKLEANRLVKQAGYQLLLTSSPPTVIESLVWDERSGVLSAPGTLSPSAAGQIKDEITAASEPGEGETRVQTVAREEWRSVLLQILRSTDIDELASLETVGLEAFIDELQAKVNEANDVIDLGFTRTQTDIYRVRQLMLGNAEATRLATSPVLAEIAKGETAIGTRQDISAFVSRLKRQLSEEQPAAEETVEPQADVSPHRSLRPNTAFPFVGAKANVSIPFAPRNAPDSGIGGLAGLFGSGPIRPGSDLPSGPRNELQELELIRRSSTGRLAKRKKELTRAVVSQAHITGKSELFRTTTVAQRLDNPEAMEAKNAAAASMYEAVLSLSKLRMFLSDIPVTGLAEFVTTNGGLVPRTVPESPEPGKPYVFSRVTRTLGELAINNNASMEMILDDPSPDDGDEAAFFSAAIDLLEHTAGLFRRVEGRINNYQLAIDVCREALGELSEQIDGVRNHLREVDDELAEARHDLNVAIALRAEELERVESINTRRQSILDNHVRFLAYQRPRMADLTLSLPVRALEPGLYESPLRHCLTRRVDTPDELDDMAEVLRDAPLMWFPRMMTLLRRVTRVDTLRRLLQKAGIAAQIKQQVPHRERSSGGRLGTVLSAIIETRSQRSGQRRARPVNRVVTVPQGVTWLNLQAQARDELSVGDLIDAAAGSEISREAAGFLDRIMNVAACLYERAGDVKPGVRLDWADDLSTFDEPPNLRNLASLEGWGRVPNLERRALQELTDFLFQQVAAQETEGVELVNDLVRVCILLASHAPVKEIITGALDDLPDGVDTSIVHDVPVTLRINPRQVRVGMEVELPRPNGAKPLRGVVEDLLGDRATARFQVIDGPVRVTNRVRFHFGRRVTR